MMLQMMHQVCVMEIPALGVSSDIAQWVGQLEEIGFQQRCEGLVELRGDDIIGGVTEWARYRSEVIVAYL